MVVFIVTAFIVKVPFKLLPFFCATTVKIVMISCACSQFLVFLVDLDHETSQYSLIDGTPCRAAVIRILSYSVVNSLWGHVAVKHLWDGRIASSFIDDSNHERPGTRWKFCCLCHDLCHCKRVTSSSSQRNYHLREICGMQEFLIQFIKGNNFFEGLFFLFCPQVVQIFMIQHFLVLSQPALLYLCAFFHIFVCSSW